METKWDLLVSGEELDEVAKIRAREEKLKRVDKLNIVSYQNDGWVEKKKYSNGDANMAKRKDVGPLFEDQVWTLFYKMGFTTMNRDSTFRVAWSDSAGHNQQIDVLAIDNETCLLIECKAAETENGEFKHEDFKKAINEMKAYESKVAGEIKKKFGKRKIKLIFATKNITLGKGNQGLLEDNNIMLLDNDTFDYYKALVSHLGKAARYQLLGNIFAHRKIAGLNSKIPAIRGMMGGKEYYAFLIDPERLLKISYVLHRNNANKDRMPTYQRLIKKDRLKKIRSFVDNGGYFPNSLIISIDDPKGKVVFEPASKEYQDSLSSLGVLLLPQTYQSAYIIDGQHRLYGYSESKYASKNCIPVIAFVNLPKSEQLELFMEINENQKSVSKSLRNTLLCDMNFNSEDLEKRKEAVILTISQKLGEDEKSPLYNRVVTGENSDNEHRCITIEYLKEGFKKTHLFNRYKNNVILQLGVLDRTDSQKTVDTVYPFICKCLDVIKQYCSEEWKVGNHGYLTINNTMTALIRIIGDIIDIVIKKYNLSEVVTDCGDLFKKCEDFLLNLCDVLNDLVPEKRNEIKNAKGGGAKEKSYRVLAMAFMEQFPDYKTKELEEYYNEHREIYNDEAKDNIDSIFRYCMSIIIELSSQYDNWEQKFLSSELEQKLTALRVTELVKIKRASGKDKSKELSLLEFVDFDDIKTIVTYDSNWSNLFKTKFISCGSASTKNDLINWLKSLQTYKKKIDNGKPIQLSELQNIRNIKNELLGQHSVKIEAGN